MNASHQPHLGEGFTTPSHRADADRWRAHLSINLESDGKRSWLGKTRQMGPVRIQRPFYPEGDDLPHLYLLHPPGGMVGGDEIGIEVTAEENAKTLITTPSASKFYRNITPLAQRQTVSVNLALGASLEYLPQETIIFDGANAQLHTRVNLAEHAHFCGWDIISLGRHESGELFNSGSLTQKIIVYSNQRPLFMDRCHLPAQSPLLTSAAGMQAYPVFGSFIMTADIKTSEALEATLTKWRAALNPNEIKLGFTQKPGVFIARSLACRAEVVRESFTELWQMLRPETLHRPACPPRIWNT